MGLFSNLRGPRTGATHDELPVANGSSSSSPSHSSSIRRKLSNLLPICVALVVIAEIGFLGRLDKVALVDTLTDFFTQSPSLPQPPPSSRSDRKIGVVVTESCEEWLTREDSVTYSRDFHQNPIFISGGAKDFKSCSVDCTFEGSLGDKTPDAVFGLGHRPGTLGIIRSMESAQYYPDNDLAQARRRGYDIVMTTSLSSDVPVGYFSWAEYDIMAPLQPKTEKAIAAAFISNCGARNFRLQALEALMRTHIKIDSYGGCHRNRDGKVDKVEALKRYKFSLAFENTNEEDYVTEKFFQSLVAGSVPVVVGAPNIQDFAPASGSILHIKSMEDVEPVAKRMKYLADNPAAYNQTIRWKYEGPSDSFKALVDMAAVHSSCRLCIFLATRIQEQEEKSPSFKKRPCKCTKGGSDTVYHVFVRERGRFEMESIFLRGKNLTQEALQSAVVAKFKSLKHEPVWKKERPVSLKGDDELRVHKIYPLGLTQRQALYNFKFEGNSSLSTHIQHNPCAKFEVVFV
ncbi:putative fucosyltransferase-like protein [Raphanus sativus]|uniref:Fucosyltransferase n=1 Tax=Raphanus sativus TaxID=3726 RepID=A0A6J0K3T4_RAPSA|nr:putative fucosyltransferase-like protein [Raphanus sativus]KAJ4917578.1 putative fucosyltransferase-like protein [Raphanus sativus]